MNITIFPITIIHEILLKIQDDLDRISFYLTCKTLFSYGQRDQYLLSPKFELNQYMLAWLKQSNLFYKKRFELAFEDSNQYQIASLIDEPHHYSVIFNPAPTQEQKQLIDCIEVLNFKISEKSNVDDMFSILKRTSGLKRLSIEININELVHFPKGAIPNSVKELSIGFGRKALVEKRQFSFRDILEIGSIPDSVSKLIVDQRVISHDPNYLVPTSVENLLLNSWDSETPGLIPNSVKKVVLGSMNQTIAKGVFPPHLTELEIADIIKHKLEPGVFPDSITKLRLNFYKFPLDNGVLPKSLELLNLGMDFIHKLDDDFKFPDGLKSLKIGSNYNHPIPTKAFPPTFTELGLPTTVFFDQIFPNTLEKMVVEFNVLKSKLLPPRLKYLVLLGQIDEIQHDSIPNSVEEIDFHDTINCPIPSGILPSSLKVLNFRIGIPSTQIDSVVLPSSVVSLFLGYGFDLIPNGWIPQSVKQLTIENYQVMGDIAKLTFSNMPSDLRSLVFSGLVFQYTDLIIPKSVKYISLELDQITSYEEQTRIFLSLISQLFLDPQRSGRLVIKIRSITLLSFGQNEPYLYMVDPYANLEYFIKKSNLEEQLYNILMCNEIR
eukprot:gene8558-10527_t